MTRGVRRSALLVSMLAIAAAACGAPSFDAKAPSSPPSNVAPRSAPSSESNDEVRQLASTEEEAEDVTERARWTPALRAEARTLPETTFLTGHAAIKAATP